MEDFLKKVLLSILSTAMIVPAFAFTSGEKAEPPVDAKQAQAKAVMGNVYDSYVKIIPYVYSTNYRSWDFSRQKDKKELLKNLNDLSLFFKSAKHADMFQRPGFRPSLDTINEHLEETIISVESNNYVFAQKRLNVLGALCVSCHSQLPESVSKNAFGSNIKQEKRELFDSDFSYANYLYLVRRFDDAKTYFNKALDESLSHSEKRAGPEVLASLRKIISIDTKIKFDYDKANAFIIKWEKDNRLSSFDRKMITRWRSNLQTWKGFNPASATFLREFIDKNLTPLDMKKEIVFSGEDDINLFVSSGVLLNYLVVHPDSELAPEILYWLSKIEHKMSQSYFFSLGDLYLKDCIKKYPSSAYAKKCYQEYADSIESGYSGSSGTDIPPEEKRELVKLKNLLK